MGHLNLSFGVTLRIFYEYSYCEDNVSTGEHPTVEYLHDILY